MSQPTCSWVSVEEFKSLNDMYNASQQSVTAGNQRIEELENKIVEIEDSSGWMKTVCVQISLLRNTFEETTANAAAKQMQSLEALKDALLVITETQHHQQKTLDQIPIQLGSIEDNTVNVGYSANGTQIRLDAVFSRLRNLGASIKTARLNTSNLLELTKNPTIEAAPSAAYTKSILKATEEIAIMLKGPDYAESDFGLKTLFNKDADLRSDEPIYARISGLEAKMDSAFGLIDKMYGKVILEALRGQKTTLELTGMVMDWEIKKHKGVVEGAAGGWKRRFGRVLDFGLFLGWICVGLIGILQIVALGRSIWYQ
ncbi:hypothetical protein VTL71DRAFT_12032 [Oculimacula yallundae]|uniref:Uncharacterized protein n=1 Tax=Oculimacula yallundae TaxID=86028 RepID=A0ABR4CS37_9HELO